MNSRDLILAALAKGKTTGRELGERLYKLPAGHLYVHLNELENNGFVASREVPRSNPLVTLPRREYWLTAKGFLYVPSREPTP